MIEKIVVFSLVFLVSLFAEEKIFVVERESSALAVIEKDLPRGEIKNLHNLNHAVVKFKGKDGYLITRDGYVVRFDPMSEKVLDEYKTSKSAIGFVVAKDFVAVANYDDKSVDILSRDLKPIQKIVTNSRNVGIKLYKNYLLFSEMDKDAIAVYKRDANKIHFKLFKELQSVGVMPFDAMIDKNLYINGFFASPWIGVLNLDTMEYKKVKLQLGKRQAVLKVPHFGFWSIAGDKIFIPAVGDNKVFVFSPDFKYEKAISVQGMPVFTSLSPNKRYLAVTFSGKDFPTIQIIDTKTLKIIKTLHFDGKVLHVRWSKERPYLYVSVNDTNKVAVINTNGFWLNKEIFQIKKPSGIFIYEYKEARR